MEDRKKTSWKIYQRSGHIMARPYEPGEDLSNVSVSDEDDPSEGDMICRNPENSDDEWLVDQEYFEKKYVALENADVTPWS